MAVSGKRVGTEFTQIVQQAAVRLIESNKPGIIIGPAFQVIEALNGDSVNEQAIARDADGDPVLYDGTAVLLPFFSDTTQLTGAVTLPSLLDKVAILPNSSYTTDTFFKVFLNPPGQDELVELVKDVDYRLIQNNNGNVVSLFIESGRLDSFGNPFSASKKAHIVIGLRALRRDFSRTALRLTSDQLDAQAGSPGIENPLFLAASLYFQAAPSNQLYLVGVDEITDAEPEGTYNAYRRSLQAVESVDAYGVCPLTFSENVIRLYRSHVIEASAPEGRMERRLICSTQLPTTAQDDVILSGSGDLSKARAYILYTDGATYDVAAEAVQAGSSVNNNLFFEITDSGAGGLAVTHAGNQIKTSQTSQTIDTGTGTIAIPSAVISSVSTGDLFQYDLSSASGNITGNRLTDSFNFAEAGVSVGDKVTYNNTTYTVLAISTTTNPNDTLVLDATLADDNNASYSVEITSTIVSVDTNNNKIIVDLIFPSSVTSTDYLILDPVVKEIVVDLGNDNPNSQDLVAFLNGNDDVRSLATFYVGSHATLSGAVPVTSSPLPFTDGSDSWTQFYTNADVSQITTSMFISMESEPVDFQISAIREFNGSVILSDPDSNLTGAKVTEAYSIYTPGAPLTITTPLGTEPDVEGQVDALIAFVDKIRHRRVFLVLPDTGLAEVNGQLVQLPGYYFGATLSGLFAALPPEQGLTEYPLPTWTGLKNSNDYFTEKQLTRLTENGFWVLVQDNPNGPVVTRKQYSTDVSSDLTAESSIGLVEDSLRKDIRRSVRPLQGINNLTPSVIDKVATIIEGVGQRYLGRSAIKSFTLNRIATEDSVSDLTTLYADISLSFYGPFNDLRVKIFI